MLSRQWHGSVSTTVRVGLDLGTSGLKAVAVNAAGDVVSRACASYPTRRPEAGAAEQDPGDWLDAIAEAVSTLAETIPVDTWQGIGLSAMLPTLVTLDADRQPTGPAITWEDSRAESWGDELRGAIPSLYERTGQWVDGRYLLPMWMRLRESSQDASSVTALAGAKDYVFAWLTGELVTDPSTAAGFGCYDLATGHWMADVRAAADITLELPRIAASGDTLPLSSAAATRLGLPAGLPVTVGAADSVLGASGMGASKPGDIAYVAGSSTVILGVSTKRPVDPAHRFIVTPMATPGIWGLEMDLMATGGAITWLAALLGYESAEAAMSDARAVADGEAPLFLPYVSPGEQGALWDPALTGVIAGLHVGHSRAHILRALVEGIVVESLRCVAVLREYGCEGKQVRVAGGSALDPWFRQLLADATGATIVAPVDGDSDYSAIGAAMLLSGQIPSAERIAVEPQGDGSSWHGRLARADAARHALGSPHVP